MVFVGLHDLGSRPNWHYVLESVSWSGCGGHAVRGTWQHCSRWRLDIFCSIVVAACEATAVLFSACVFQASVNTIAYEALHLAWWNFAWIWLYIGQPLKPYKISRSYVKGQGHVGLCVFLSTWYTRAVLSLERRFYLLITLIYYIGYACYKQVERRMLVICSRSYRWRACSSRVGYWHWARHPEALTDTLREHYWRHVSRSLTCVLVWLLHHCERQKL